MMRNGISSVNSFQSSSSFAPAPIALALDAPDLVTLGAWAQAMAGVISTLKVGLETFCKNGAEAVDVARANFPDAQIFLDLKLHDIPATVSGAARAVAELQPAFLTVHASGGAEMIRAAAEALPTTAITAVTILTSLDDEDLASLGFRDGARDSAVRLATMAVHAGARAIVCSPHEVAQIRSVVPAEITLITPGVRPQGAQANDQKRAMTPEEAIAAGADLLVIGRPITGAPDPRAAAQDIAASLRA